jgi:hypothetical protein
VGGSCGGDGSAKAILRRNAKGSNYSGVKGFVGYNWAANVNFRL